MTGAEKHLRADALRNRERILEAAADVFGEHGIEVSVGEVARRAGVGRATLFRNFPTKQDLIAAIVVERMRAAAQSGRELLGAEDPGEAVYAFIREILGRQQMDRGLFEAVAEEFLVRPEIRDAVTEVTGVLSELLDAGKRAGVIRPEVGAFDVMMLVKGLCVSVAAFGDAGGGLVDRHVDLVFAAITTPAALAPASRKGAHAPGPRERSDRCRGRLEDPRGRPRTELSRRLIPTDRREPRPPDREPRRALRHQAGLSTGSVPVDDDGNGV